MAGYICNSCSSCCTYGECEDDLDLLYELSFANMVNAVQVAKRSLWKVATLGGIGYETESRQEISKAVEEMLDKTEEILSTAMNGKSIAIRSIQSKQSSAASSAESYHDDDDDYYSS
jgi:hypothetical protein